MYAAESKWEDVRRKGGEGRVGGGGGEEGRSRSQSQGMDLRAGRRIVETGVVTPGGPCTLVVINISTMDTMHSVHTKKYITSLTN